MDTTSDKRFESQVSLKEDDITNINELSPENEIPLNEASADVDTQLENEKLNIAYQGLLTYYLKALDDEFLQYTESNQLKERIFQDNQ